MSNTIQGFAEIAANTAQTTTPAAKSGRSDFFDTLQGAIGQVEQLRTEAIDKVGSVLGGDGEDIHSAMIAVEKANLAFEMMVQVRNKIVQAYLEVSRMPF
jgi:flagellar hook-basal body complex protein FliE